MWLTNEDEFCVAEYQTGKLGERGHPPYVDLAPECPRGAFIRITPVTWPFFEIEAQPAGWPSG
jgi:hypothetical protein